MEKIFKGMDNGPDVINGNFNELSDPKRDVTVNDLTVNGQLTIAPNQKNYSKTITDNNGLQFTINRIGNIVFAFFSGNPTATGSNVLLATVPAGYRPISNNYFIVEGIWDNLMTFLVTTGGQVMTGTHGSSNGGERGVQGSSVWITQDDFPE
ncbi:hypothetical protein LQZ24_05860 [Fructobacillus sp. M1-13]|uniref:Uncharacterized protein n=1 Tax=Fructobacillus papyriferae TaxID=2713171 RepID=A0ABS5QPA0_9LACO|nr:hypothetical protein [Fructobacillus papyriferae]MBS9334993.1 hypothetical protein [Fructobacillus papyriferae]MCD2159521.1 hypothetical protein [Fructobacillus papyriferae]